MISEGKSEGRHDKLPLSSFGTYASNELALIGAPCSEIRKSAEIIANLLGHEKCIYIDADHHSDASDIENINGFQSAFSDKISFNRFESFNSVKRHNFRFLNTKNEIALINGNHFNASLQLVFLHPEKLESLSRKLDRITNPIAIISHHEIHEIPAFLKNHFEKNNFNINIISIDELDKKVVPLILQKSTSSLKALVLAGGKSERMGQDKTLFNFHGKKQREYLVELLSNFISESYISCRQDQVKDFESMVKIIPDRLIGMGPYGAIVSAFMHDPNAAWLVIASDLPFMDQKHIEQLIAERDPFRSATAFKSPKNGDPEPLAAIWEPSAYPLLLAMMSLGFTCPRKALLQSDAKTIDPIKPEALLNINTPADYSKALELLKP